MKKITISTEIEEVKFDELSAVDRQMVEAARAASLKAYAPYSKFYVGAAVKMSNGNIITGANQENAAFPSGTCAERSAIYYAGANNPDAVVEILAIASYQDGEYVEQPTAPCGACRQAILEYETLAKKPIRILLAGRERVYIVNGISALLPLCFDKF